MGDWRSTSLEWPWPWPWFRPYGIPSCITHRPLPIYQISLKWKKLFVDGRTYGRTFFPSNIIRSTFGSRPKNSTWKLQDHYDDERDKHVFHNIAQNLQDQDQDQFFWPQTSLVLRSQVSDHVTGAEISITDWNLKPHFWIINLCSGVQRRTPSRGPGDGVLHKLEHYLKYIAWN